MPLDLISREDIYAALYGLVSAAQFPSPIMGYTTWAATAQKYVEAPSKDQQPFMAQFEGMSERYEYQPQTRLPPKRFLGARIWCWARTESGDPLERGSQYLNYMMQALENALMPDNPGTMSNTLGGLVQYCRIEGIVIRVPGDTDQQALLIVPILMLWPN
jgi:hypothetical protein